MHAHEEEVGGEASMQECRGHTNQLPAASGPGQFSLRFPVRVALHPQIPGLLRFSGGWRQQEGSAISRQDAACCISLLNYSTY